jgi:hypothetical protein
VDLLAGGFALLGRRHGKFHLHNPTRIHFGRWEIAKAGQESPANARVLLLAGGDARAAFDVRRGERRRAGTRLCR